MPRHWRAERDSNKTLPYSAVSIIAIRLPCRRPSSLLIYDLLPSVVPEQTPEVLSSLV